VDADVIVIGAGPVGGIAARQLARRGLSVRLLEEHSVVGRPVHCAGLIGINGLRDAGIRPKPSVVIGEVSRSVFHAPSGVTLVVDKGAPHAYVVHRDSLDQQIVRQAQAAGAELELDCRVLHCHREASGIRITTHQRASSIEYSAQVVVDAEGIGARLARENGLSGPRARYVLRALQYEVSNVALRPDTVHLFFNNRLAPGFFAWIIPLGATRARIGLAAAHNDVRRALDRFVAGCPEVREARIEKRFGGLVYTGGPAKKTVADRFVAAGDAAGQTKATTGGGVVAGCCCAIIAAGCIERAVKAASYDGKQLSGYERIWKRGWGRQLELMALLRRLVNTLNNAELDRLFVALRKGGIRALAEATGDIDRQSRLIRAAFANPRLVSGILPLLLSKLPYLPLLFSP
jgi:digeranylgeranylglycerophospholipid reductase